MDDNQLPHQPGQNFEPNGQNSQAPNPDPGNRKPQADSATPVSQVPPVSQTNTAPNYMADDQAHAVAMPGAPMGVSKKPLIFMIGIPVLLVVLAAYYIFFVFLPNTPNNIWRRGVASIGVGLDELIETEAIQPSAATQMSGQFTMQQPQELQINFGGTTGLSGSGTFEVEADWLGYNPKLETVYHLLESGSPQLYFRFSGVQSWVDGSFGPGTFNQIAGNQPLENIWWLVDYEAFVQRGILPPIDLEEVSRSATENSLTAEDYTELLQALINASNEYLFTADTSKMVLQQTEDLGVENFEGVESRKYAVTVDQANLKSYLKLVRDNVASTQVVDKLLQGGETVELPSDAEIDEFVDEIDFSELKIEAWVGLDNKVLRNVRFMPTEAEGVEYVEVSLLLEGTDLNRIPIRLRAVTQTDGEDYRLDLGWTADVANNSSEFSLDLSIDYDESQAYGDDVVASGSLILTGLAEEPAYEIPADSRSFLTFVEQILGEAEAVLGIQLP